MKKCKATLYFVFAILFGAAVYYRKNSPNHKRLMLLTMINFLGAAIARFPGGLTNAYGPLWFHGVRILNNFPGAFDKDRDDESPREREFVKNKSDQPELQNAVKYVGEGIRDDQMLRVVRRPNVPRPRSQVAFLAPPHASLQP